MNETDFRDNLAATAENLRTHAEVAASEATRAAGLAVMIHQDVLDGNLLQAADLLEEAREALIESGQHMMTGLRGTRLHSDDSPILEERRADGYQS